MDSSAAALRAAVSDTCLDQIFREARTHNVWLPQPVPSELLQQAYELSALGPTSANKMCIRDRHCKCSRLLRRKEASRGLGRD